jgi:hypothetical protein
MKNFNHISTKLSVEKQDQISNNVCEMFEAKNSTEVNHFSVQFLNDEEVTFECHSELGSHWVNVKLNGNKVLKKSFNTQEMKEWEV